MNAEEIKDFWNSAFIQFPALHSWLETNSPDISQTLAVWSNALRGITGEEALRVLSRWSTGELEPPAAYQRESFHLHVRAVVMADRSKTFAVKHREEQFRKQRGRGRTESYLPVLGPFMRDVRTVQASYESGLISELDRDRRIEELKQEAMACCDSLKPYIGLKGDSHEYANDFATN